MVLDIAQFVELFRAHRALQLLVHPACLFVEAQDLFEPFAFRDLGLCSSPAVNSGSPRLDAFTGIS